MIRLNKDNPSNKPYRQRKLTLIEKLVAYDLVLGIAEKISNKPRFKGKDIYNYALAGMFLGIFISIALGAAFISVQSEEVGEGLALLNLMYATILVLSNGLIEKVIGASTDGAAVTVASIVVSFVIYEVIVSPLTMIATNDIMMYYLVSLPIICILCIIFTGIISMAIGIILKLIKTEKKR